MYPGPNVKDSLDELVNHCVFSDEQFSEQVEYPD